MRTSHVGAIASSHSKLRLSPRDLSTWREAARGDAQLGEWRLEHGTFTAHVGGSSRALPLQQEFQVVG